MLPHPPPTTHPPTYIYQGCSKKDTKKHKQNCSAVALFLAQKSRDGELASTEVLPLIQKHMCYIVVREGRRKREREREMPKGLASLVRSVSLFFCRANVPAAK